MFSKKISLLVITMLTIAACGTNGPTPNKSLADDTYAITHIDMAATDTIDCPTPPKGTFNVNLHDHAHVWSGPVNIMTLNSTDSDYVWAISSGDIKYVSVRNGGFNEVARLQIPGEVEMDETKLRAMFDKPVKSIEAVRTEEAKNKLDWMRIANGVYSVIDKDNNVYYNVAKSGKIFKARLKDAKNPARGIEIIASFDLRKDVLKSGELLAGLSMTYDGMLVIIANHSLSILDRDLKGQPRTVRLGKDETVTNSVAIDEKNGIYVASDKNMRKIVWTGERLSMDAKDGAWKAGYDFGTQPPTVKIGNGTGSTPTLMGFGSDEDKLVVITDGADQMKLVAFWRDQIPQDARFVKGAKSDRVAGQIKSTMGFAKLPKYIQTEQSVVVKGYGAFVVNNIAERGDKDKLVDVVTLGPINKPGSGVERFEWDTKTNTFKSMWARPDVVSTSMVPTASSDSNMVFVNGYNKDGWNVTGLNWDTGHTEHYTIFGSENSLGNGAYAIIQFFPNGDLLFNSIAGPFRVKYNK